MWVQYNEWTNCLHACVQAHSFTNCLHGKAAERAVYANWDNSAETKKPIENIYSKIEAKELEIPSLFNGWSLETLPQIISLIRKYLFHIPYLARDNYSDNDYWHEGTGSWFSLLGKPILAVLTWL